MSGRRSSIRLKYEGTIVYEAYGPRNRLLYVGITDNLFDRMGQHRATSKWWSEAVKLAVTECASREEAESLERQLIQVKEPPYNTQHQSPRMARIKRARVDRTPCKYDHCEWWAAEDSDLCPKHVLASGRRFTDYQRAEYERQHQEQLDDRRFSRKREVPLEVVAGARDCARESCPGYATRRSDYCRLCQDLGRDKQSA